MNDNFPDDPKCFQTDQCAKGEEKTSAYACQTNVFVHVERHNIFEGEFVRLDELNQLSIGA